MKRILPLPAILLFICSADWPGCGSFTIPGVRKPSWSHPVIHGGKLYLREQDRLLVYNLR